MLRAPTLQFTRLRPVAKLQLGLFEAPTLQLLTNRMYEWLTLIVEQLLHKTPPDFHLVHCPRSELQVLHLFNPPSSSLFYASSLLKSPTLSLFKSSNYSYLQYYCSNILSFDSCECSMVQALSTNLLHRSIQSELQVHHCPTPKHKFPPHVCPVRYPKIIIGPHYKSIVV